MVCRVARVRFDRVSKSDALCPCLALAAEAPRPIDATVITDPLTMKLTWVSDCVDPVNRRESNVLSDDPMTWMDNKAKAEKERRLKAARRRTRPGASES